MRERYSDSSLVKKVCLGITGRVEWIGSVFRKWSGGLVKRLLWLKTFIVWEKDGLLPIRSEHTVELLLLEFGHPISALLVGREKGGEDVESGGIKEFRDVAWLW